MEKILAVGKTYALMPLLFDVDTEEDWNMVAKLGYT